jgi:hypothetical protein
VCWKSATEKAAAAVLLMSHANPSLGVRGAAILVTCGDVGAAVF